MPENRWKGHLPYAANPRFVNPEGGIVGNTNNKTVDRPFPRHVSFTWGDTQRVQRWTRLMQEREVHSRESFIAAQLDTVSPAARTILPLLAAEGLTGERLARLAGRMRRADAAIETAVDQAAAALAVSADRTEGCIGYDAAGFFRLPEEVALRLLGRAIDAVGIEGPAELAKLEALLAGLQAAQTATDGVPRRVRRTLAGAQVTVAGGRIQVEPAPPRGRDARKARPGRSKAP